MSSKKRKALKTTLIVVAAIIFIAIVNVCESQNLPSFIQKPLDNLNAFSGSLLYQPKEQTKGLSIHYIDVGTGDSELIECEGKNMLIDSGTPDKGKTVCEYLHSKGVSRLDYIVCTHPHNDHIGGMTDVVKNFDIGKVLLSPGETTSQPYEDLLLALKEKKADVIEPQVGLKGLLGTCEFEVLAPNANYTELNDTSIVLKLKYKNNSFLFMGDAEKASETDILEKGFDVKADVLKVGHHGSKTSTSDEFLKKVNPSIAIVSVGEGNSYGLPSMETIQKLKDADIKTLRTDVNGTITIMSDGKNINYEEEKCSGNFK